MRLDAYAARNAGVRGSIQATRTLLQWMIAEQALGRPLGDGEQTQAALRDYAEWWRITERSAWDQLAKFRAGFPGEETPSRLAQLVARSAEARRGAAGLARVHVRPLPRHVAQ